MYIYMHTYVHKKRLPGNLSILVGLCTIFNFLNIFFILQLHKEPIFLYTKKLSSFMKKNVSSTE